MRSSYAHRRRISSVRLLVSGASTGNTVPAQVSGSRLIDHKWSARSCADHPEHRVAASGFTAASASQQRWSWRSLMSAVLTARSWQPPKGPVTPRAHRQPPLTPQWRAVDRDQSLAGRAAVGAHYSLAAGDSDARRDTPRAPCSLGTAHGRQVCRLVTPDPHRGQIPQARSPGAGTFASERALRQYLD